MIEETRLHLGIVALIGEADWDFVYKGLRECKGNDLVFIMCWYKVAVLTN